MMMEENEDDDGKIHGRNNVEEDENGEDFGEFYGYYDESI